MYSCSFEGNNRSPLYSLYTILKQVQSWVANAPQDILL